VTFAEQTHSWSRVLVDGTAAASMGMLAAVTLLPRHMSFGRDVVAAAIARLPLTLDSEVRGLCTQSIALWTSAKDRLAKDDENRVLLQQGVVKVLHVATNDSAPTATVADQPLSERIAATDDETRTQYQSAKQALTEQQQFRDKLTMRRERLVAKLHHHVAALEKFQLAALGATAGSQTDATRPVLGRLAELSAEVSSSAASLTNGDEAAA
jgi:hypothetical protein